MLEKEGKSFQEKTSDPAQLSFEERLLRSREKVVFSGGVTLAEVLGVEDSTLRSLAKTPFAFKVIDLGDTTAYIASFPEDQASFGGERLVSLLRNAKPVKKGEKLISQNKSGIIDDWIIMDGRSRGANSLNAKLYTGHVDSKSIIKEHFEEFGRNHFAEFWNAIKSFQGDVIVTRLTHEYGELMSKEEAFTRYGLDFLRYNFERFIGVTDNNSRLRNAFAQFLKKQTIDIADFSDDFTDEMKEKIIEDFYEQLDDDARKTLIYETASSCRFFSRKLIFIDEEGNLRDMHDNMLINKSVSKISNDEVEIREGDSYMRVRFERDEKTGYKKKKIVEVYVIPQEGEIVPTIIWETDKSGKRKYFCGKISAELIKAFPEMFSKHHDSLLGQIVVAGYCEYLKHILPTKLPLVKGGTEQYMREPQMPVFVKLFEDEYLSQSPVILGLEALARQSKS